MVTWFYFIVFVLALVMTGSFLTRNRNVDSVFCLFSILVTINCLGRYMLATADSLEMAIWANKFLYVGGCYAPLMTVIVLAKLCNTKMPRPLLAFMTTYSTVVICLVMTIGKCGIYYKDVQLEYVDGYNYLIKTYGPLHTLYPVMMVIYALIMIGYLVYAVKRRNEISFRAVTILGITGFAVITMYILERVIGSNVSFLAVGYLVGIALMTSYFERIKMYDMSVNIVSSIERLKEYGYIVFDDKYRYVNANDFAKYLFPEIKTWIVDGEVPFSDDYAYREVVQYLLSWNGTEKVNKILSVRESYYQMNIRKISYGKKSDVGFLVELVDRTLERKYYNTMEEYNASLEKQVEEKTKHILHIKDMMVLGMADMVESRDNNTGGHIKRTSAVVKVFAQKLSNCSDKLGLDNRFLQQVEKAAPMHDLGKIAVDDALVSKRCYKEALSYDQAFAIIEESLGQHFDPEPGKIFMECRPELETLYRSYV